MVMTLNIIIPKLIINTGFTPLFTTPLAALMTCNNNPTRNNVTPVNHPKYVSSINKGLKINNVKNDITNGIITTIITNCAL